MVTKNEWTKVLTPIATKTVNYENNEGKIEIEVKESLPISEQLDIVIESVDLLSSTEWRYDTLIDAVTYGRVLAHYTDLELGGVSLEELHALALDGVMRHLITDVIKDDIAELKWMVHERLSEPANIEELAGIVLDFVKQIKAALPDDFAEKIDEFTKLAEELGLSGDELLTSVKGDEKA